jgi:hypothetical protein
MEAYYSTMMQVITILLLVILIESSAAALFLRIWLSEMLSAMLSEVRSDEDDELLLWKGGLLWKVAFCSSVAMSVLITYIMPALISVIAYVVSIDNLTSGRAGPGVQLSHRVVYLWSREGPIVRGVGPGDAAVVFVCLVFMIALVLFVSALRFSLQRREIAEQLRPKTRPHGRD